MLCNQFMDYTKGPLHTQLATHPKLPASKFHIFYEAVGLPDAALYTHSSAYVAKGGAFVTVGPQPHGCVDLSLSYVDLEEGSGILTE